jgi:hypothetical protein
MPRDLNRALQAKLKDWKLALEDLPQLRSVIRHYLQGTVTREIFIANLAQVFHGKVNAIPRKGARGGHDRVPTPRDQEAWIVEEVLTIVESAKLTSALKVS